MKSAANMEINGTGFTGFSTIESRGAPRLLFGNSELLLNGFITSMLERRLGPGISICRQEASSAGKLLHLAHREPFDLVILILNNLRYDAGLFDTKAGDVIGASLELIHRLRLCVSAPLVAMASAHWDMDPALPERVRAAGATAFFSLPFQEDALARCLLGTLRRAEISMVA
jgi:hypothetical protein